MEIFLLKTDASMEIISLPDEERAKYLFSLLLERTIQGVLH
jgi:hypothetical protein